MLYGDECEQLATCCVLECGEEVDVRRIALGYTSCLDCGDKQARAVKRCVVPLNKSNYMLITDYELLKQLNPKRT